MKSLVPNKSFIQTECLTTLTTFKWFFSSMNPLMVNKLRDLTEGLATFTIFVWFIPSVEALMANKIFTLAEGLATLVTCIRLLPTVDYLMVSKISIGTKSLPTLIALIRFLTSLKDLMSHKTFTTTKSCSTLLAFIRFLPLYGSSDDPRVWNSALKFFHIHYIYTVSPHCGVYSVERDESCAVRSSHTPAFLRLFPCVASEVNSELRGLLEGLPTRITLTGLLSCVDSVVAKEVGIPTENFATFTTWTP